MFFTFNKEKRLEYKFLKKVILQLRKTPWTDKELRRIYFDFQCFVQKMKVDEIAALRTGEVFLGKYCKVDLNDLEDVKDLIYKSIDHIDEITSHVCIVIIGALAKLAIANIDGKIDFNKIKEEL